ncbi:LysR family transcriptional regulator [Roseomonas sp. SSH11]|uniref:LysR family transcriptional regulator n=1 Tax=Pararoseomonas baculiformis TaxID=2820812 RepID=A0ABS4AGA6_9PROT|nr:LysR substrate-binding domain-containing protein [Pararoseomonas baculiformis]MBP0445894.1 LysR family transcriptional regulator [Pararoseomonas baculiformis]
MKLHQLRTMREVVAQGFSLSRAARQLNASQPGLTRHLQELERQLGVALFVRGAKRLSDLTPEGRALLPTVLRILDEVDELHRAARDMAAGDRGSITIATIDTHARYVLPAMIERLLRDFPTLQLRLLQGSRIQVANWLRDGEADISVAGLPSQPYPDLVFLPCYEVHRLVLTPPGHPLARLRRPIRLEEIASHPIITYDPAFEAWAGILGVFQASRLSVNIVLSAIDVDIMKTYVRSGLGVGIVADLAYSRSNDRDLRAINARHLFPSTVTHIGAHRRRPLSVHARHLISFFGPDVGRSLDRALRADPTPA